MTFIIISLCVLSEISIYRNIALAEMLARGDVSLGFRVRFLYTV